jgi:cytochrome d ubiquinol oxidase subunit I
VTEFGRQPWVIYGVLRTSQAITNAPGLGAIFSGFTLVYLVLSAMTIWLLRRLATGAPTIQSARAELAVAA